ncbi:MAG: aldo/keto reductase [Vulcanimicrobiota bacterium]
MTKTIIAGRATPEATSHQPNRLGKTGLGCSRLGFGCYRIDFENPNHREAIEIALDRGVNLIDTSTNYTDGESESAVGEVLARLVENDRLQREQVIVVSKIGYVQGQNFEYAWARDNEENPIPEMVRLTPGLWHCIHPEFLEHQLQLSLERLGLATLDVCLLHNPEYFLMEAAERQADLEKSRQEFYDRVERAFAYFEAQVKAGRIGSYGVSSNNLVMPVDHPESTQLEAFLEAAERAGGKDHHFGVIQLPLNLLEWEGVPAVLETARAANLGVMVNRPLNAYGSGNLIRLADFELDEEEEDLAAALAELERQEERFRQEFLPNLAGPNVDQLFRWAPFLQDAPNHLQGLDHWLTLEEIRIRPHLAAMLEAVEAAAHTGFLDQWLDWKKDYTDAFRGVSNAIEERATRLSHEHSQKVGQTLDPRIPEQRRHETLSRKALWLAGSPAGVSVVLNGMRRRDYVEDSAAVLEWTAHPDPEKVLDATSSVYQ